MSPQLSVVIPSYADAHALDLTLGSLARQSLPRDRFEVIVVLDGDDPRDYARVDRHAHRLSMTVVPLPRRLGRAGARNAGVARAAAPFVLFLDNDVYAEPGL